MPARGSFIAKLLQPSRLILVLGFASAALIAGAWWSQLVWHLVPCKLCLEQRQPHYAAIGLAVVAAVVARTRSLQIAALIGFALLFAWSTGLGAYHAGVEWGWFLGPNDCGGGAPPVAGGVGSLLNQLQTTRIVSCTEAAWRFLGLSLAGWNALISLGLLVLALLGLKGGVRGLGGSQA
jgi:disulfide bond formation protein DsbB